MTEIDPSEHWVDRENGSLIINETSVPFSDVENAIASQYPELAALSRWGSKVSRAGSVFDRDKYLTPENPYDQMKVAYEAAQADDIVSAVLETSESLAFGRLDIDADNEDEENIWEQIFDDILLDDRIREMWRELFTVSQFYAVTWWGKKSYRVKGRGTGEGSRKRRKEYTDLQVPIGITLLDPLKVVPVGEFSFGQERLAFIATEGDQVNIDEALAGENTTNQFIGRVIEGKYSPSKSERTLLSELGISPDRLYLLKKDVVWRVTDTRSTYERLAPVRMRSVFEILDLKRQLREMDRAHLVGGTNFILLVKKGTDDMPAKPAEITSLAHQIKTNSRLPIIVGDHRLEIEIITPKTDATLQPDRYNGLDARISARLYGMFMTGNFAAGAKGDDSIKLARVIARGIESRRARLMKAIERNIIQQTLEKNQSKLTAETVEVFFNPRRIALDFDPSIAAILQDLRDRGDLSRETILDEIGIDQSSEARRRKREKSKGYDDIFAPTVVPYDSPVKTSNNGDDQQPSKKVEGINRGGNSSGGGVNPDSFTPNSNPIRPRGGKK